MGLNSIQRALDHSAPSNTTPLGANLKLIERARSNRGNTVCSETNIPLGVDDPDTKGAFSKVVVDVYGGAKKGTKGGDTSDLNSCDIIQFPNCGPTEVCKQARLSMYTD